MVKRLALIPARGGSKRIKNKNIKNFCGKPMIYYPINELIQSKIFDKIHVSTESDKIVNVVKDIGLEIDFKRSQTLSDDFTPIMPVIKFVVKEYEKRKVFFDEIWLIMACNPLLDKRDLINASKLFKKHKNQESLIAVSEYPAPIEWAFSLDKKNILNAHQPGMFLKRSQDIQKSYYDIGSFAVFSNNIIKKSKPNGFDSNYLGYIIPKGNSVDIDDIDDWKYAEKLFLLRKK